jgi:hypothetical protein
LEEFWKCLKSKFETKKLTLTHIDCSTDSKVILHKFVARFSSACTPLSYEGSSNLRNVYTNLRLSFRGKQLSGENSFDAELIENSIAILERGKAVNLDYLLAEHFNFCYPLLPTVLTKLFNIMISAGHVPLSFCYSSSASSEKYT